MPFSIPIEDFAALTHVNVRIPYIWGRSGHITIAKPKGEKVKHVIINQKTLRFLKDRGAKDVAPPPAYKPRKGNEAQKFSGRRYVSREKARKYMGFTKKQIDQFFFRHFDYVMHLPWHDGFIEAEILQLHKSMM